jgi:3-dehydroquinate synthase
MQMVTVALGERSYAIHIGQGVLDAVGEVLAQLPVTRKALVVTQPAIAAAYGDRVLQSLRSQGFTAEAYEVLDAE